MKPTTLFFALSALFLSSTDAQVRPHFHRRAASNSTISSTSFMLASTASPFPPAKSSSSAGAGAGAGAGKQITINPGDTLGKIAAANGVGICDIAKANGIKDPNLIFAGAMLTIPVVKGEKDNKSCLP